MATPSEPLRNLPGCPAAAGQARASSTWSQLPGWIAQSERKRSAVRGAAADRLATEARHGVRRLPYGRALRRLADPRTRLRLMKVQPAGRLFLRVRIWLRGQGVPFLSLFPQNGPFFYHTINSADTMIESDGKSRAPSKAGRVRHRLPQPQGRSRRTNSRPCTNWRNHLCASFIPALPNPRSRRLICQWRGHRPWHESAHQGPVPRHAAGADFLDLPLSDQPSDGLIGRSPGNLEATHNLRHG